MGDKKKSKRESNQRRLVAYPNNYYLHLFIAECHTLTLNKSVSLTRIVKKHFDNKSEAERQKLLRLYERMSEDQRRHPDK